MKESDDRDHPFLEAIINNDIDVVKLLVEYANKHSIILTLNEKDSHGGYSLLYAIDKNNVEISNITLELTCKDLGEKYSLLVAITYHSIEMI